MRAEERCKHELLTGTCSWCKGLPDLDPSLLEESDAYDDKPRSVQPEWIAARYAGRCADKTCRARFEEGDPIRFVDDIGWICNHDSLVTGMEMT